MRKNISIASCLMLALAACPPAFAADPAPAPKIAPSDEASDIFVQLGRQKHPDTTGVLEGKPLDVISNVLFPWDPQPTAGYVPEDKIDTQEKLNAELKRMRERYAPFMADLAPAITARTDKK